MKALPSAAPTSWIVQMCAMIQRGGGFSFAMKARERLRIAGDIFGKKFQRDIAMQASVFGFVHHAHAAIPDFGEDAVMPERLPHE